MKDLANLAVGFAILGIVALIIWSDIARIVALVICVVVGAWGMGAYVRSFWET